MSDPSQALAAAAAQIAALQSQLNTANAQIATLTQQNAALTTRAITAEAQVATLTTQVANAEYDKSIAVSNAVAPLNAQIAAEKQKQVELQGQIDALNNTITEKNAEIEAANAATRAANVSLDALQTSSSAQVSSLTQSLATEQGRSAGLQAQLDVINAPVGPGITKTAPWFMVTKDRTTHPTQMDARVHIISTETGMSKAAAHELMNKHAALDPTITGAQG